MGQGVDRGCSSAWRAHPGAELVFLAEQETPSEGASYILLSLVGSQAFFQHYFPNMQGRGTLASEP